MFLPKEVSKDAELIASNKRGRSIAERKQRLPIYSSSKKFFLLIYLLRN